MGKPSPPPAPNYAAAAQQQGLENELAAQKTTALNNPNVISPYGNVRYESYTSPELEAAKRELQAALDRPGVSGGHLASLRQKIAQMEGRPTLIQEFSPEQQGLYEQQVRTQGLLGGLGEQGATALQGVVGKELDFSGAPALPGSADETRNKVINAMMARVNEDTDIARETTHSNLIAAGIRPGSKAYDNRMRLIDRAYNDARNQAFLASGQEMSRDYGLDEARRRQVISEILAQRQVPLNEITALLSGSQVSNPFVLPGYAQNTQVGAAPVFGATQLTGDYATDLYNAKAAQSGNIMSGLFGLGQAGIGALGSAYAAPSTVMNFV